MFKRNHRKSDTDLRARRSLDAIRALAHGRSSEQILRPPPLPRLSSDSEPRSPALNRHQTAPRPLTPNSPKSRTAPRFSLLRFRNASDSALGLKARDLNPPPVPPLQMPPEIVTTAPPSDPDSGVESSGPAPPEPSDTAVRMFRNRMEERASSSTSPSSESASQRSSLSTKRLPGTIRNNSNMRLSVTFDEPDRSLHAVPSSLLSEPPPYEDNNTASLPLPGPRLSESSRSTVSSGEQTIAYSTTTTTHTTTTTTFFRLPRRKKKSAPLFPLPSRPSEQLGVPNSDPEASQNTRRHTLSAPRSQGGSPTGPQHDTAHRPVSTALASSVLNFTVPGQPLLRSCSYASNNSGDSRPSSPAKRPSALQPRARSSTLSSLDHRSDARQVAKSGLGGLLERIRRDNDPASTATTPRTSSPQPYQLALSAPTSAKVSHEISIPKRNEEDTPPVYLSKLFEAISKSVVASLLARNEDAFHMAVLKAYMETFDFENYPMDMALRKLLMEVELPTETQQIDRVLQAFADRYHECNPFIYKESDEAYYIAFSLIMLHTDFFNKNNKRKMQKPDYVKNTSRAIPGSGISKDILECFYANITYTPFIRLEDEFDINGQKIVSHRPRKGMFHRTLNVYDGKRMKEPIDPYSLIIDNQLDLLRPSLKDVIPLDDPYSYAGTTSRLDMASLHRAFFRSGILQIVSPRSRPDAFMTQQSMENPEGADPGVVEIKVTKVGLLWRKELKRKKTRSPWQEWGAMLTGSQLYFFRNIAWVKSLMHQHEQHHKHGSGTPVIFKPPLEQFKPDVQISTDDAVALLDKGYKKHKNAFAFLRHGGLKEYFIADSEPEMNDWLAKLNYAATFRTAGVRMRGVVGEQRARGIRRIESISGGSSNSHSVQTPTGEVNIVRGGVDTKLAAEIAAARREVIERRIFDFEDRIATANRELQTNLRAGRHLMILAPIQPRTREQVVMAAANLAAKLQWVRMEMWKLRCHRDILALDMDEERKALRDSPANKDFTPTSQGVRVSPARSASASPVAEAAPTPMKHNVVSSVPSEELSPVVTHSSHVPSHKSVPSVDYAGSQFERRGRESVSSAVRSPSASSRRLRSEPGAVARETTKDDRSIRTCRSRRSSSLARSQSSLAISLDHEAPVEDEKDTTTTTPNKEKKPKGKDKDSRNIRRSLHRTLRESSQGLGHHRRGKSNDHGDTLSPDLKKGSSTDEGLARSAGSFTVHGKKASVITFGSEWQNMSPEDRLKRHRSIQAESSDLHHNGETESLHSVPGSSRRENQPAAAAAATASVKHEGDDDTVGPSEKASHVAGLPSFSHQGSNGNGKEEQQQLAGVPESGVDEKLLEKLHGVAKEKKGQEMERCG